jgi:hypothetical protein
VRKLGVVLGCAATALAPVTLVRGVRGEDGGISATPGGGSVPDDAAAGTSATMTCERVEAPGRVRCDVEARVGAGESLAWGDVVIVRTPPFVGALRGRIGPDDTTARSAEIWRWALALVARTKGAGDVEGRVRLVVCRGERCGPIEMAVTGRVVVGE